MWFGSRISLVSWLPPFVFPCPFVGELESWSTMKAPVTFIFTDPGWVIVLSISAVFVRMRRGFELEEGLLGASLLCTRDSLSVCDVSADMTMVAGAGAQRERRSRETSMELGK